MSVVCENSSGWVICHYRYIRDIYRDVSTASGSVNMSYPPALFNITSPFVRDAQAKKFFEQVQSKRALNVSAAQAQKRKKYDSNNDNLKEEVHRINECVTKLIEEAVKLGVFCGTRSREEVLSNNKEARAAAAMYHKSISNSTVECNGGNNNEGPLEAEIVGQLYLCPGKSIFYQFPVEIILTKLNRKEFDVIVLDPPWRNKFVKRRKNTHSAYSMMSNEEFENLPLGSLLKKSGMVMVWTTNAPSHICAVKEKMFPAWGVRYVATWFWIKVTKYGDLICPYFGLNGKQPYERILIGCKIDRTLKCPEENKCIVCVPSAIHSHKPPLVGVLRTYLPENPECLELFARYLLHGWTSYGNQVLSLQQSLLFSKNCE